MTYAELEILESLLLKYLVTRGRSPATEAAYKVLRRGIITAKTFTRKREENT
jgi:hypothetical protein